MPPSPASNLSMMLQRAVKLHRRAVKFHASQSCARSCRSVFLLLKVRTSYKQVSIGQLLINLAIWLLEHLLMLIILLAGSSSLCSHRICLWPLGAPLQPGLISGLLTVSMADSIFLPKLMKLIHAWDFHTLLAGAKPRQALPFGLVNPFDASQTILLLTPIMLPCL